MINEIEKDNSLKETITFYEQLKKNLSEIPDYSLKRKLANRISGYELQSVYTLYPDKVKHSIKRKKFNVLAADSLYDKEKVTTKTFTDPGNNYLIRTVSTCGVTKVYVFSFSQSSVKDFTIILSPTMEKFRIEDNSQPLLLEKPIEIDSITIDFFLEEEKTD